MGIEVYSLHFPGIGHKLYKNISNRFFLRGGKKQKDFTRGLDTKIVRGALDTAGVVNRKQARSRYGTKKPVEAK
jgi:small subunit ribosomal protein S12